MAVLAVWNLSVQICHLWSSQHPSHAPQKKIKKLPKGAVCVCVTCKTLQKLPRGAVSWFDVLLAVPLLKVYSLTLILSHLEVYSCLGVLYFEINCSKKVWKNMSRWCVLCLIISKFGAVLPKEEAVRLLLRHDHSWIDLAFDLILTIWELVQKFSCTKRGHLNKENTKSCIVHVPISCHLSDLSFLI